MPSTQWREVIEPGEAERLGEMMRARKVAYKVSAIGREAQLDPMKSGD